MRLKHRAIRYASELAVGLFLAALVLWVAFSTVNSTSFVYQGY